ncbi:MAG TPA: HAD-IA family hydrolase [Thermoanaerobaculia bacterium]|jgi:putative hydrolase of the HAD superfamily
MIEAVTFDVTRTLLHVPRLGEIYAEVLGRHGVETDPGEALRLFSVVWQELACSADPGRDRFTSHPEGERGWWRRLLERMCELKGAPPPSRFAAAELFHRFGTAEPYEVYPEVPEALARLREEGLRLGVVSNWDHRLPQVLGQLGLARFFGSITCSARAGVEKPDRRIFHQAVAELGIEPAATLHVGDGRLEDVEGAVAAGLRALHLTRTSGGGDLRDLSSLPDLVAAARAGQAGRQWAGPVIDF